MSKNNLLNSSKDKIQLHINEKLCSVNKIDLALKAFSLDSLNNPMIIINPEKFKSIDIARVHSIIIKARSYEIPIKLTYIISNENNNKVLQTILNGLDKEHLDFIL